VTVAPDIGLAVNRARGQGPPPPWRDPDLSLLDAQIIPPPPFPKVLPAGSMQWALDTAESAGCPVDYVGLSLLAGVSTLIGNARWGQPWEGWREPPALFVGLVGRPSSGKSPGLDVETNLLAQLETECNADWEVRRRAYKRDLAATKERRAIWENDVKKAIKDKLPPPDLPADAEDPDPPQRRRLFSTEPTVEKAARMAHGNPRGLQLVRDELAGWIGGMDRYSRGAGSDRAFWLQAYGGRHWTPDRIKDGEHDIIVPHLLWGVSGGIQPDRIASQLLAGDDDGLAARFLYSWPIPVPPRRPSGTPDHTIALAALRRLVKLPWQPPEPVILSFTDAAAAALQALREEVADLENSATGMFLSWLGKLPGFCVRLAVILQHLAWGWNDPAPPPPKEIEEWAVADAADFLEGYAVPMARRVFGEATLPQAERDARTLARWLVRQAPLPETINARELRRMSRGPGITNADRMSAALDELAEADWVGSAAARAGGYGRPRRDWSVNPLLEGVVP
jgi:hypothetical protein